MGQNDLKDPTYGTVNDTLCVLKRTAGWCGTIFGRLWVVVPILPHLSLMVGAELTLSCPEGRSTFRPYLCVGRISCTLHQGHVCCVVLPNTRTHQMVPPTKKKKSKRERNHLHLNLPSLLFHINLLWVYVISLDYLSWKGSVLSPYRVSSISKHCSGEDFNSDVKNYDCFLVAIPFTVCEDFHISLQQRMVGFTAFSFHYLTQTEQTKTCWADLPVKTP